MEKKKYTLLELINKHLDKPLKEDTKKDEVLKRGKEIIDAFKQATKDLKEAAKKNDKNS